MLGLALWHDRDIPSPSTSRCGYRLVSYGDDGETEMICAVTSRLTIIALIWASSCPSAVAQSAPASTAPNIHIDTTAPPTAPIDDASALAEKLQNPIADLISIPFQNNTNFNVGPNTGTQDILNIQPVIPIHLNEDWNMITRTILPLVWSPILPARRSGPAVWTEPDHVLCVLLTDENYRWLDVGCRSDC